MTELVDDDIRLHVELLVVGSGSTRSTPTTRRPAGEHLAERY